MKNKQHPNLPPDKINPVMSPVQWGLIIILSVLWGGSFFFVEVAVKEVPTLTLVWLRVCTAWIILAVIVRAKGMKMPSSLRVWGAFFILGALNNAIPFCLFAWGQTHIDSGLAGIFNATSPIFSVVLAHFFIKNEKLTINRGLGAFLGWAGVCVLIGIKSFSGLNTEIFGQLAALAGAGFYAVAAVYGSRFETLPPLVVATGMLLCSTIMLTPFTLIIDQPWHLTLSGMAWVSIFLLAAVSTALAYIIYFHVLAVSGPTNLMLVTFLIPVSAIGLGVMLLGEKLEWKDFSGLILIFTGLIAIDGRCFKMIFQHQD